MRPMTNQWAAACVATVLLLNLGSGSASGQGAKENWQPQEPAAGTRQVAPNRQTLQAADSELGGQVRPSTPNASPPFGAAQSKRNTGRDAQLRALTEAPDRQVWFIWDAKAEGCVPLAEQAALYSMVYSTPEQYARTISSIVIERQPYMALVADADSQNYQVLAFGVGRAACRAAKEYVQAREPPPSPPGTWFTFDQSVQGCVPLDEFGLRTPEDLADKLRRIKGSPFRVQHRIGGQDGHAVVTDAPRAASDLPGEEIYMAAQNRWDCVILRREMRAWVRSATIVDLKSR